MGQKTHPIGFRLGGIKDWRAHWFAGRAGEYRSLTLEDQAIRRVVQERYGESGAIAAVEIERGPQDLVVTVSTARPGIVIGRGGQRVDELRADLEALTGKRARLNINEVRQPELDATLVARNVAEQLERRVAYRRALRLTIQRTMQAGAKGIKIIVSGRLGGAEIARTDGAMEGRIPLHTLRADIDFAVAEARTTFGQIGVKVWIYKGDILGAEAIRSRALERMAAGTGPSGPARAPRGRGRPARPPGRRERVAAVTPGGEAEAASAPEARAPEAAPEPAGETAGQPAAGEPAAARRRTRAAGRTTAARGAARTAPRRRRTARAADTDAERPATAAEPADRPEEPGEEEARES